MSKHGTSRPLRVGPVFAALVAMVVPMVIWGSSAAAGPLAIKVLSNRADLISGGDALVEVVLPSGVQASDVQLEVDGRDVTGEFAIRENGKFQGVVTGLEVGPNVLTARLPDDTGAQITITNHPSGGPVLSGQQVQPWACKPGGENLQCDRPPSYEFLFMPVGAYSVPVSFPYLATDPRYLPYDPVNPPPAEAVAQTTTDQGQTVPYIIRVETGTVDRGEYKIAVLYDPASSKPWKPWDPQSSWNHKLFLIGGGGCDTQYNEGTPSPVLYYLALARGFAVMATSHIVSGHTCNMVVQAESLIMAKEHLIEAYGPVRYTFGIGSSGAAFVQQWVANGYPGIYDGLIPQEDFPDGLTIAWRPDDCAGLVRYWHDPTLWAPGVVWTPAEQSFVQDGELSSACEAFVVAFGGLNTPGDAGTVPPDELYDPQTNPAGVRGTIWDYAVSVLGRRPTEDWGSVEQQIGRGFANRPLDNVGVQYGLKALMNRLITPAQFVDLNIKVGGHDIDYNWQADRTQADPAGLANSYRSGLINQANNLHIPIVALQSWDNIEFHSTWHSWSMRARLERANGHHDNQIIWLSPIPVAGGRLEPLTTKAFELMDRWLSAIENDPTNQTLAQKVVANKPADAVDLCGDAGVAIPCFVPPSGSPRLGAGQPLTDDTYKCQLMPMVRTSYFPVVFTDAEWAQLQQTFPSGVCDWSKPGVGQQQTTSWLTYEGGPGGQPLGAAPESTSI